MKRVIALLLITALVLVMGGCTKKEVLEINIGDPGGDPSVPSDPKVDPAIRDKIKNSKQLDSKSVNILKPGEICHDWFDENQSIPYRWAPVVSDESLIKLFYDTVDTSKVKPNSPPGSGGEFHWFYFEALRAGECSIDVFYADIRESDISDYEKVTYTIVIEGADTDPAAPGGDAVPSDAEIEAAYQKADEAYRWFTYDTMPLALDTITRDGAAYQRVDFPGITSFDTLRDYLLTIFAPNIAAGLVSAEMSMNHYAEFDGVLYAQAANGVPGLCFGGTSSEIIRNDDGTITYRVTTDVLDDETFTDVVEQRVHNLTYSNLHGEWLFIWFENVYNVN